MPEPELSLTQPIRMPLEYHGLERSILLDISRDKVWRRREVVAQVVDQQLHFARLGNEPKNVEDCLRRASCEVSRVSTLFAQFRAQTVVANDTDC